MALVNSFDQWQKISVPSNSYLSLKQLNDGQCQWELIEKTHAKPAIKDWQNLPANEFNHLQTKRLYQSLTSLIEDSKTRRWFVGEQSHYQQAVKMMAGVLVKKLQVSPELIEPYAIYLNASAHQFAKRGLTTDRAKTAVQLKQTAHHLMNRQWDLLQADLQNLNHWWD